VAAELEMQSAPGAPVRVEVTGPWEVRPGAAIDRH
jgi:hypothetical protein